MAKFVLSVISLVLLILQRDFLQIEQIVFFAYFSRSSCRSRSCHVDHRINRIRSSMKSFNGNRCGKYFLFRFQFDSKWIQSKRNESKSVKIFSTFFFVFHFFFLISFRNTSDPLTKQSSISSISSHVPLLGPLSNVEAENSLVQHSTTDLQTFLDSMKTNSNRDSKRGRTVCQPKGTIPYTVKTQNFFIKSNRCFVFRSIKTTRWKKSPCILIWPHRN